MIHGPFAILLAAMKSRFLQGKEINPPPIVKTTTVTNLVDSTFQAYNAARLREACHLFVQKMLKDDVTVGFTLTGALTPAGLGISCLIPLIENGFIDWIVSTGANLYHDTHFGMGQSLHQGSPAVDDVVLHKEKVVRIYDIFVDYHDLLATDAFYYQMIVAPEFQKEMSSAELHYLVGKYVAERERLLGIKGKSFVAAAYHYGVPIYTSSPGDSTIGMNIAAKNMEGSRLRVDVSRDVNETTAIVLAAKQSKGKSAVFVLGGGSPKNFMLQTEPQLQEILGITEKGHDYFLQFTDARADTGGLSGATPGEAVTWGKIDPDRLPESVVCYLDSTIALPIITAYAIANHPPRKPKHLYHRLDKMMQDLKQKFEEYLKRTQKLQQHSSHATGPKAGS